MTGLQQSREIWKPCCGVLRRAEHSGEYKLVPKEGADPKAALPTALKIIFGVSSLPVWRQGQHTGGGTEIKPPDSQKNNLAAYLARGRRTIAAATALASPEIKEQSVINYCHYNH